MAAGYPGVGAMGQPMAHKLLDVGHSLTIYDINEAAMQPLLQRQALGGITSRRLSLLPPNSCNSKTGVLPLPASSRASSTR